MGDLINEYRLDKTYLSVAELGDDSDDGRYWRNRTPEERWKFIEYLRQINYGYDPATTRLQRVLEVAQLGEG